MHNGARVCVRACVRACVCLELLDFFLLRSAALLLLGEPLQELRLALQETVERLGRKRHPCALRPAPRLGRFLLFFLLRLGRLRGPRSLQSPDARQTERFVVAFAVEAVIR